MGPQPVLAAGARPSPGARQPPPRHSAPLRGDGHSYLWMKYSLSWVLGSLKLNIFPLSISARVRDEAEINRRAVRSPCTGSGRRQLMRQIPPRCLMFQGYDRTVYKTSSVIYTVIISRGALNFRFTCSLNTVPRFRLISGSLWAESRREAAHCRGAAGVAGGSDPPRSCRPPGPRRRARAGLC